MKLSKAQKDQLLQWVGEGLESGEINRRAALFEEPFQIRRQQVDYYRQTRKVDMQEITRADETSALQKGLALREERVKRLAALAEKLEYDLMGEGDSLWVSDVKAVNNEPVYITRFNAAEVSEYRALLEQIAEEVGDTKPDNVQPTHITVQFVKPADE